MTADAIEIIKRLKADRRAELERIEAEQRRQAEERKAADAAALDTGLRAALDGAGFGWLLAFRADAEPEAWKDHDLGTGGAWVPFAVPGHRRIALMMERVGDRWRVIRPEDGAAWKCDNGLIGGCWVQAFADLADALIAADPLTPSW